MNFASRLAILGATLSAPPLVFPDRPIIVAPLLSALKAVKDTSLPTEVNPQWIDAPYKCSFLIGHRSLGRRSAWSRKRRLKWQRREMRAALRRQGIENKIIRKLSEKIHEDYFDPSKYRGAAEGAMERLARQALDDLFDGPRKD